MTVASNSTGSGGSHRHGSARAPPPPWKTAWGLGATRSRAPDENHKLGDTCQSQHAPTRNTRSLSSASPLRSRPALRQARLHRRSTDSRERCPHRRSGNCAPPASASSPRVFGQRTWPRPPRSAGCPWWFRLRDRWRCPRWPIRCSTYPSIWNGVGEAVFQAQRDLFHVGAVARHRDQRRKLVAAQPRQQVAGPQLTLHARATSCRYRSPTWCPYRSFTCLNSSRST